MWHLEQNPSTSDPERDVEKLPAPRSNRVSQPAASANGLWLARTVPSGGAGTSQLPCVEICRADNRNAARHAGSRHAFAIIDPFHSSKMRLWQPWHVTEWLVVCHDSSNGGGKRSASAVTY